MRKKKLNQIKEKKTQANLGNIINLINSLKLESYEILDPSSIKNFIMNQLKIQFKKLVKAKKMTIKKNED